MKYKQKVCLKLFGSSSGQPCWAPRCPPGACPIRHFLNGLFCSEASADSLGPPLQVWRSCFVPISDTASSSGLQGGAGSPQQPDTADLELCRQQRWPGKGVSPSFSCGWQEDQTPCIERLFTVYAEPPRITDCYLSTSLFPSSLRRAVSFQLRLTTESSLTFSWKAILPSPKECLHYSPKKKYRGFSLSYLEKFFFLGQ